MLSEPCVALSECFISIVLILCLFSPVLGDSWKFQTRHPRIAKPLQSWGHQPLWAALSIMAIGGSLFDVLMGGSIPPDVLFYLICIAPYGLYRWHVANREAKANGLLRREREINALMPHDRDVDSTPIDETLIFDDSEPGHLPHV